MRKLDNIQNHNSSEELMPKVTGYPQVYVKTGTLKERQPVQALAQVRQSMTGRQDHYKSEQEERS